LRKVIARNAIGVDTIDISAASRKNIFVANLPDYCIDEVADTAIAHILNAMRKISLSRDLVKNNQFSMDAIRPIKRISDNNIRLACFGKYPEMWQKKTKRIFKRIVVYIRISNLWYDYPLCRIFTV
jgi:D-3-phosphoglycerate dehydrogenase